jgi:spore germination protein
MNYIMQPGETIYHLSNRFNVSVETIMTFNELSDPSHTYPGQLLFIPTPYRQPVEGKEYIVQQGDTLYDIAVKHNVSMRDLIRVNYITLPYIVYAGQSLILPDAT